MHETAVWFLTIFRQMRSARDFAACGGAARPADRSGGAGSAALRVGKADANYAGMMGKLARS